MKAIYNIGKESIPYAKEAIKETLKVVTNTPVTEILLTKDRLKIEDRIDITLKKEDFGFNKTFYYKPPIVSHVQTMKNSINHLAKNNFSSLTKNQSYFYSSITSMNKSIDVTNDYVFKGIFSDEGRTKNFLESVLIGNNKILPEGTKIEQLEYLKNEHIQNKTPEDAKKIIFDLQIKTNNGIYIIEMQKNVSKDYLKRVEFYNATAYSHQQIKGSPSSMKDYTKSLPIVTISIINTTLFPNEVPCVSYHTNVEQKTKEQYMKAFSYVFIELGKFDEETTLENVTEDEKDWLSFMKTQNLDHKYHNEQVNSAVKYVQDIRDNKYEEYVRFQMSELAAQKEIESAEEKGKAKGKAERNIEIARNLKQKGIESKIISETTGLSTEEIDKL
jgi:predicted transposase/invertase (TIGR01784 family)